MGNIKNMTNLQISSDELRQVYAWTARQLGGPGELDVRALRGAIFTAVSRGKGFGGYFDDNIAATLLALCVLEYADGSDLGASILASDLASRITESLVVDNRNFTDLDVPVLRTPYGRRTSRNL